MRRLFSWFILRRLAREPLRSAASVAGIAVGVAVIVAIQLTNASSVAGFASALDAVAGRASLEVASPGGGLDERRLPELGWLREFGDVAPVIEGDVVFAPGGRPAGLLRVLGVDVLRDQPFRDYRLLEWAGARDEPSRQEFLSLLIDPASVIVPAKFAAAHGLAVGSSLDIETGDRAMALTVRALLKDEGPARALDGRLLLMDIAAAQRALDRFGRIDRLEVRLAGGHDVDVAESAIASRLPAGLIVERPATRGRQVETMLAAFHLNLTALSYVAFVVGLFLVYNTVSVAVLARRDEIGALRALGVTRRRVAALFLGEAAALAAVGSALGLMVARLLADAAVALTSTTVTALYVATAAAPPALTWWHVALAFGTGVPLSLVAALVPAAEAARVPPVAAIRGADRVEAARQLGRRFVWLPLLLLALAAWFASRPPVDGLPVFGYAAAAAVIFGTAFLVPAVLTAVVRVLEPPVRRHLGVADWLAVNNLAAAVPRVSISVAALAVSLAMTAAIAIMVGSFRDTVIYWVGQSLQADLFLSPGSGQAPGRNGTLSPEVVGEVAASPDVAATDQLRVLELPFEGTRITIVARDLAVLLPHGSLLFKAPADAREALGRAIGRDAVAVSESFAVRHHAAVGETVSLPTPAGPAVFDVAAVYYDYSNDRGVVLMDGATFARHFGERGANGLGIYLRAGVDPDQARDRLLAAIGPSRAVFINTNASLRREVLRIFDSTFAITWALELVAIVVAMLGVSDTLVTLVLEREREFTMLRLVGASRRQVRRMVVGEAVLIGAVSQGVGLAVGLLLSLVLIYVITIQSFGWTIQFHLPVAFGIASSLAVLAATAAAGLYPARRAIGLTMRREE